MSAMLNLCLSLWSPREGGWERPESVAAKSLAGPDFFSRREPCTASNPAGQARPLLHLICVCGALAPIGGLLFAIEEGASHISQPMLWRTAICSCLSYATLQLIKSFIAGMCAAVSRNILSMPTFRLEMRL